MAETALIPATSSLPTVQSAGFKRLRMKHRRIVALHLNGCSNAEIAKVLEHDPAYISQVLHDPLVAKLLEDAYADFDMELRALVPGAIDAIRRNQRCGDGQVELRAADLTFKANHRYIEKAHEQQTAEDVVERLLEILGADGTRLRYSEKQFLKGGKSK